jgi:hypothetical protein
VAVAGSQNILSDATTCTVLIAAPDLLPSLKKGSLASNNTELIAFSDAEALRALEVISKRRPKVVALEKVFAATPRGAALINRIKADPALSKSEIRVVSPDGDESTVAQASPGAAGAAPAAPLDHHGTRRAPRFRIAAGVEIAMDGKTATLMDLSAVGAQVVSPTVLKPNQRLRIVMTDEQATLRIAASVAWASFEMPPKVGPRYRAGIQFIDANAKAVDDFRTRHQAS